MSLAKVRVVARGGAATNDEVWVDGVKLPAVREYQINGRWNDVHTITVTILADPVTVEYEGKPRASGVDPVAE